MADKKISELPVVVDNIYKISDSDVVAMVSASTTAQVTIKTLREKLTEFTAKTGSANTFTGNQIINGSVSITGKLTVNDIETIYQTSSVVFSSGSNKFGDNLADKHEFTGSTAIVGALTVNGDSVNISSLNDFTSSQLGVNTGTSIVTASFNAFSSSQLGVNTGISIVTSSINNFTSSQLGVNTGISIVTASFNAFSSSQLGVNVGISIVTSSLNAESKSVSDRVSNIQAYTASVKEEISQLLSYTASINSFTSSEKIDVANIQAYTASVKYELGQIFVYTGSVKETISQTLAYTASVKNEVANIQAYTASVKYELGQVFAYTGSVKNEIGQIVAYTSSLNSYTQSVKNEVANIQAYTASVKYELGQVFAYTSSVKTEIGQIVAYTASLNTFTSSAKLDIAGLQSYSHSLKSVALVSSSQQVIDYNKFALTASSNTFYGNQTITGNLNLSGTSPLLYNGGNTNAMLFGFFDGSSIYGPYYQIFGNNYAALNQRGSAEFVFDSRNGGDNGFNVVELNNTNFYRKLRVSSDGAEVTGSFNVSSQIQSVGITSSILATNNVVSSSQQISNYYKFAETASANTFYGTQSITGSLKISGSIDDIKYIDFDQLDFTSAVGRVGWDTSEGTLTMGVGGGTLDVPVGVIQFETVYNADSSSISKGEAVRIIGAQGNRISVKKAHALDDDGSAEILGLAAETIGVGIEGKVIKNGPLKGVDTTGYTAGQKVYLSTTAGQITVEKPQAPVHLVWIGTVQKINAGSGIIHIHIQNGYEIEELHDVRVTTASLADNQLLARSGSVWANKTINELGIAITGSNTFIGTETISGSLNISGSVTINNNRIDNGWTAYTPEWTAASSNPAINNGTIEGYYKVVGKTCFVRGNIAMGSTTTFGTGEWYVSMPFTASHSDGILMTATLLDNSTAWYNAILNGARAGFSHKSAVQYQTTGGTSDSLTSTTPFTWASGDRFTWNGSYEIA